VKQGEFSEELKQRIAFFADTMLNASHNRIEGNMA